MTTAGSRETVDVAAQGYIMAPGESFERPFFPNGRILAGSGTTGGLIAVEEGVLEPGQSGPYRHYHPHIAELFYVLEGELLLQIGEQVQRAPAGTFAFCPAGCVHAFRTVGTEPARVLIMVLPPALMEGYWRELAKLPREAGEAEWNALGAKWGNIVVGPPLEEDGA